MSMVVKNNMSAVKTLNTLNKNSSELAKSLEKVSSGMKINSAKDDAASFAISEKMREQIRSMEQDSRNVQNATSMLKVAEGAVNATVEILRTIKEKAIDAATDTNTDQDRKIIQKEIDQFMDQVNDNALVTFNSKYLLDGSTSTVVVGDGTSDGEVDEDARTFIIKGLSSEWVRSTLGLIDETFGIGFDDTNGANAGTKDITVYFAEENSSALAWVSHNVISNGKSTSLDLYVNMKYYDSVDTTDPNGSAENTSMYLDRVLAHEFVHAAMAANITDFNNLPSWFIEGGTADLVQGADNRATTMVSLLQSPTTLQDVLDGNNSDDDNVYAAGFMVMRYMTKATVDNTAATSQATVAKNLMQTLANTSGNATDFDSAIRSASNNYFSGKDDLISKFMNLVNNPGNNSSGNAYDLSDVAVSSFDTSTQTVSFSATSAMAFLKDKFGIDAQYYSTMNYNGTSYKTNDPDTGAITGSDAGGATSKNAEDIVPETTTTDQWSLPTSETSTISGLTVHWPDGYTTEISSDGKRTKSMGTLDLINSTKSLGDEGYFVHQADEDRYNALSYDSDKQAAWIKTLENAQNQTLDDISVVTKDKANVAIRVIDGAIEYALNQATDIGAYLQRFDYTGLNVTTMTENTQAAESTIRDADMAKEMTAYTKNNVLLQAAQSMLAQANQNSSAVLSLLQ